MIISRVINNSNKLRKQKYKLKKIKLTYLLFSKINKLQIVLKYNEEEYEYNPYEKNDDYKPIEEEYEYNPYEKNDDYKPIEEEYEYNPYEDDDYKPDEEEVNEADEEEQKYEKRNQKRKPIPEIIRKHCIKKHVLINNKNHAICACGNYLDIKNKTSLNNVEIGHCIPYHKCKENNIFNLVPICRQCNRGTGGMHKQNLFKYYSILIKKGICIIIPPEWIDDYNIYCEEKGYKKWTDYSICKYYNNSDFRVGY